MAGADLANGSRGRELRRPWRARIVSAAVRPKPVAGFRERSRTPTAGSLRPLGAGRSPPEQHCREQRPRGSSSTLLLREGRQVNGGW